MIIMRNRILRRADVILLCGLSCSTIYALMARGDFPKPVRLTGRAVGWREEDIDAWLASRPVSPMGSCGRGKRGQRSG